MIALASSFQISITEFYSDQIRSSESLVNRASLKWHIDIIGYKSFVFVVLIAIHMKNFC